MIDLNALEYRLLTEGRFDEVWRVTSEVREQVRPALARRIPIRDGVMTAADLAIIDDPTGRRGFVVALVEAMSQ